MTYNTCLQCSANFVMEKLQDRHMVIIFRIQIESLLCLVVLQFVHSFIRSITQFVHSLLVLLIVRPFVRLFVCSFVPSFILFVNLFSLSFFPLFPFSLYILPFTATIAASEAIRFSLQRVQSKFSLSHLFFYSNNLSIRSNTIWFAASAIEVFIIHLNFEITCSNTQTSDLSSVKIVEWIS